MGLFLSIPTIIVLSVIKKCGFSATGEAEERGIVLQTKRQFISLLLKISKLWQTKRVYNVASEPFGEIDKIGLVPLQSDRELDYPKEKLQHPNIVDGICLSGFNQKGDCLLVRIARRPEDKVEIVLYLRLSDGSIYKLPNLPDTRAYTSDAKNFSACGLKIQCLSAMSRWRIAYNGLLRKVQGEGKDEIVHVKFSFVWSTVSLLYDYQTDFDCGLLAEGLSKHCLLFSYSALQNLKRRLDCYEHWGQFSGTVCIGSQEEKEVFLWGPRTRNRGILDWNEIEDYQSIYGQMKDGTKFHLGTVSILGVVSKLQYGYIVLPDNFLHPIQCCYNQTVPEGENRPNKIIFKAGEKTYKIEYYQSNESFNAYFGKDWHVSSRFQYTTFALNGFEGKGFVEVGTRNETEKVPLVTQRRPCFLREPEIEGVQIPWIVDFTEKLCQSSIISGGKGSSLSMLTSLSTIRQNKDNENFVVPKGIVITTAAYRHHLSLNQSLSFEISSLSSQQDIKHMEKMSKRLMAIFVETSLSDELKTAILLKLQHVFPEGLANKSFAVRSSASGEDSEETSAAGQMQTFLGVKTIDQIYENVVKCWSSQFSLTAINYKRQTGQCVDSDMAVVIQEMIPANVAGVAFTCDPLTCNPQNITITANYGLGESVVSAAAEPDTIILTRSINNILNFQSETIGRKSIKIHINNQGGTTSENVQEEDCNKCCLEREDSLRIGRAAILVEEAFGNPRDIEWAIAGDTLYLLQARPITTCHLETDFEIIHELDSSVISDFEYLTKANIGEVTPRAPCPLAISTTYGITDLVCQLAMSFQLGKSRCVYHPGFKSISFAYAGHIFLNVLEVLFRQANKTDNAMTRASQWTVFGRAIENSNELRSIALHRYGEFPALNGFRASIMTFIESFSSQKRLEDATKLTINSYLPEDKEFDSSFQLYTIISEMFPLCAKTSYIHIESSGYSSLCNVLIIGMMAKETEEINEKIYSQFSRLVSNCGEVESADVPQSIKNLADSIVLHGAQDKILNMKPQEAAKWLQEERGEVGTKYREFIRQHGHRGLMEFDFYSPPWRMDPVPLIKSLQSMVKQPINKTTNKKKDDSPNAALNELSLNVLSKFILKMLVSWARKAIAGREKSKSALVRSIDIIRRAYRRLGKMMADEGRIPEEDLIFFLTHEEIGELLKTRSARLISKAIRRKRVHPKLDSLRFPEITCGPPQPLKDPTVAVENDASDWVIKATPVSQGKVKAKARVVMRLEEAEAIQHGEILVTYSTDIGWSPYFPLLSGVVTELGGLISHGAVVAREFGIPCIVGAANASYIVKTGDLVVLDGRNGTLKKVSTDERNALE